MNETFKFFVCRTQKTKTFVLYDYTKTHIIPAKVKRIGGGEISPQRVDLTYLAILIFAPKVAPHSALVLKRNLGTSKEDVMHKKFLTFALPVVGAAAIVGSAFSAWTFTDTYTGEEEITGTIEVTPIAEQIEVTLTAKTFTLELDQAGYNNRTNLSTGITPYDDSSSALSKITATITWKNYYALLETNNISINWSATMAEDAAVSEWITYAGVTSTPLANPTPSGDDATWTVTVPLDFTYTQKPTDVESYNSMTSALSSKSVVINVSVTASVTAKA